MNKDTGSWFIYFIVAILFGFSLFIYFLLKLRETLQKKDLTTGPDEVWASCLEFASKWDMKKSNMIYGIYQDTSLAAISLVVNDHNGSVIARVEKKSLSRKKNLTIGSQKYEIEYPLSWKKSAILKSLNSPEVLAIYRETGNFGHHEFNVNGLGKFISEKTLSMKYTLDYKLKGKIVGRRQGLSALRDKGRLGVFADEVSLPVKIFILAV